MHLRRLEVYGFKSFAERIQLEFVPGITAVVGPNGSGKSNISDAVRWVLGEQSAKILRGSKMEDIIFAGSQLRQPVNYAEVSITLDNADQSLPIDYTEVTVTRRLYRSGESEFLLNRQPCRLKDITELFMDTGLGKEAYSIIGQGRIEEILSMKAEERRSLFEEAAGIVKYKHRKKTAQQKLEETSHNLNRIQDVIVEVEAQLAPLEEQAATARRYKELKSALNAREIASYVYLIDQLHDEWQEAKQAVEKLQRRHQAQSTQINQIEASYQQIKWELVQADTELDQLQQNLLTLTREVEKLETQKKVLLERERNFSAQQRELMEQIALLKANREKMEAELIREREKENEIRETIIRLERQVEDEEQRAGQPGEEIELKLEKLKGDYIDELNLQAALKNEFHHLQRRKEQYHQQQKHLSEEKNRLLATHEQVVKEVEAREKAQRALLDQLAKWREKYNTLLTDQKRWQAELSDREEKHRHLLTRRDQLISRLQLLAELQEEYHGFSQGVKEILKASKKGLKGIDGAVAELIRVPKEYELAIETALGPSLQHIIVHDEASAQAAIIYLKKNQLGRATFLPRRVIKGRLLPQHHLHVVNQTPGVIGLASRLIEADHLYREVINYLLGQVIVARSIQEAQHLAQKLNFRYRVVTLDGDVINPGGAMTGGSVQRKRISLLGRTNEMERLKEEVGELEAKLKRDELVLNQLKHRVASLETALNRTSKTGEELKVKAEDEQKRLREHQFHLQRLQEKLSILAQEQAHLEEELNKVRHDEKETRERLNRHLRQSQNIEAEIKQLEQLKTKLEAERSEANRMLTSLKVKLAAERQKLENVVQQNDRLRLSLHETEKELSQLQQRLHFSQNELAGQKKDEALLEQVMSVKKNEREQLEMKIDTLRKHRKEREKALEELEADLHTRRKDLKQLDEERHQLEIKVSRLDVELDKYLSALREEYELSYERAKEKYPLTRDYNQVQEEVRQLKIEIKQLGTVNLGSIEEYERLKERHQFLKQQEADLLQAKKTLFEVIDEMDIEMSKRFNQAFQEIRKQFQSVFKQLFNGGRADLILTQPDQVLESGVEIVAQPPGKRLQQLSLLSSGEKALTAIALLFAILHVKPVPFCILDEVEAALDEANVSRFARYLRQFSQHTQFIVITHRKGTMEEADVLYGITMREQGVSKLVSVKLEDHQGMVTA